MTLENEALAQSVDYTDALQYLVHRGWQRVRSRTDEIAILRKDQAEVVLPLDRALGDYGEAIARAAARIAALEGGTAHSVLEDLHRPRTDTVRAGRTDAGTEDGNARLRCRRHALRAAEVALGSGVQRGAAERALFSSDEPEAPTRVHRQVQARSDRARQLRRCRAVPPGA